MSSASLGWIKRVAFVSVVVLLGAGGVMPAAAQGTGTIEVVVLDENGSPQPNSCVTVHIDEGTSISPPIDGRCDGRDDGTPDGRITFVFSAGNYVVVQTFAPQGYISGASASVSLGAGEMETVEFRNVRGGRDLFLIHEDAAGNRIGQACFTIYTDAGGGQLGEPVSATCDGPQGDPGDGSHHFAGFAPGSYVAVETQTGTGYGPTDNTSFSVPAGSGPHYVTVINDGGEPSFVEQLVAVLKRILVSILG